MSSALLALALRPDLSPEQVQDLWEEEINSLENLPRSFGIPGREHPFVGGFPLEGVLAAASNPDFLACLGNPNLVEDNFESEPEVWVFGVAGQKPVLTLLSDQRRADGWKGGSFGLIEWPTEEPMSLTHPALEAFGKTMTEVWGNPHTEDGEFGSSTNSCEAWFDHLQAWDGWFARRRQEIGTPTWPGAVFSK